MSVTIDNASGHMESAGYSEEHELTFLARELPSEIATASPVRVVDVYVPEDIAVHPRVRLRCAGERYSINKKLPLAENDASAHSETTISLDESEFNELTRASSRRVVKDRYKVQIAGRPCEVDVFRESLTGLVLLDFEFQTVEEKFAFQAPSVCLADVTQEDFIAGGLLAGQSYHNLEPKLVIYGYQPLGLQ